MRIRLTPLLMLLVCCMSCSPPLPELPPPPPPPERWAVYYDSKLPGKAFRDYDLVVFDRIYHPDLKPLQGKVTLLAYVSAGEIHGDRKKDIARLTKEKAILKHNKQWDSHIVKLTSARWRGMVLAQVKDAVDQGFDGVMLDTLENSLHASEKGSKKAHEANRQAAIQLLVDIKEAFPDIKIMLNRTFSILPDVSEQLDFILCESILAETNVSTRHSTLFPPNTYRQVRGLLKPIQRQAPQLKIYTLDYWNPDDVEGIQQLYAIQRANGFIPYVTTPDLRSLSLEPHRQQTIHDEHDPVAPQEDHDA
jgi:uncharacterized protein (TIGR01370 family)